MHVFKLFLIIVLANCINKTFSQQVGIFENQADIGKKVKAGNAAYFPETQQYIIAGAGYNIWFDHDEFHFVYKKIKGDFILYTRANLVWDGTDPHRKLGWMVRKSLEGNSAQVNAVVHGDGLTSLQYRKTEGAQTDEIKATINHANVIQLERKGNVYTMRAARFGEPFVTLQVADLSLGDEVFVGLFVGSHNADILETGVFRDVRILKPFEGVADKSTQMTLGSDLEILNVASGEREIVYSVPNSIQAPNWLSDNSTLVYNDSKGLMYTFDLNERKQKLLPTGNVINNNNDHVPSFNNKMLGLSSYVKELGGSVIYTVPINGGEPLPITPKGPSYLHGWSPDGKYLVFCGERNGNFDVYKIPAAGGEEVRLTNAPGLDDGPEYSPDGKYIYFNSVRSGSMQIWRMEPDGTAQTQITNDEFNNWFPHISPDGKSMVFISFLKDEVSPGDHPPYKHIYIRMMPVNGGKPAVVAYVYGGQGSMNTPSWSADSKKIAFISNTNLINRLPD